MTYGANMSSRDRFFLVCARSTDFQYFLASGVQSMGLGGAGSSVMGGSLIGFRGVARSRGQGDGRVFVVHQGPEGLVRVRLVRFHESFDEGAFIEPPVLLEARLVHRMDELQASFGFIHACCPFSGS